MTTHVSCQGGREGGEREGRSKIGESGSSKVCEEGRETDSE